MIRPFELFVGLRYLRAKRRTRFISFITGTSVLGIIIGVWALISVLSVMNGFERELRDRILTVASHGRVSGASGWLSDWRKVAADLESHPEILANAPYILSHGMLKHKAYVNAVLLRGVMPDLESKVSEIASSIIDGSMDGLRAGDFGIVLGEDLANSIGASVGDKVTVISTRGRSTPVGLLPRLKRFEVVAIFNLNFYEYDNGLALVHIDDLATLQRSGESVTGIRLRIADVFNAPRLTRELRQSLGSKFRVNDWTIEYSNLFQALKLERRVMFIILLLIVAVAAFNIVSTLVMLVADKQSDIAVMRTFGVSPRSIMMIFIVHGSIIGIVGTILGTVAGVITGLNLETLIPWAEELFQTEFFPDQIYVISKFPAQLHWDDVSRIGLMSLLLSFIATIYPAWRASKTHPAEALRYE